MADDDFFERWINEMPEGKLELIDGQLIISTLAGSRRIAWNLLRDHGPAIALKHASSPVWWTALAEAFHPDPPPTTPAQWWTWAEHLSHDAEPPPAGPHVTVEHRQTYELLRGRRADHLDWDTIPFAPRVGQAPERIRFAEFASWCGRAKFESYGHGLVIGGEEGTRRVFGMLLMTFGLGEIVKLAHPRDWIAFLAPEVFQPQADAEIASLLAQAVYSTREGFRTATLHCGEVPGIRSVTAYEESEAECREQLAEAVRNWVLLRLARGEEIEAEE